MATTNNTNAAPVQEEGVQIQESFLQKNMKTISIAVAAVIVVIVGVFMYNEYISKPAEQKAATEMAKAQTLFAGNQFELALNGDSVSTKGFLAIAEEYSGTDAANIANLSAGLCYAKLEKWEEAKTYLEKYDDRGDQMVSPAAIGALANVYAHLDQMDKAVDLFKKAAKAADNNTLSPEFLIQAGQILQSQGNNEAAVELYKEIKEKYVRSPRYAEVDKLIESASVK